MKTRVQIYGQEAAGILRDISLYRVLREEQLLRLHPGQEEKVKNLLAHLVRQCRVWRVDDCYCAAQDSMEAADKDLLAALWVLADFTDRVEYHSLGDFPAKIIFFADNEIYEIVHAQQGRETLLAHLMGAEGEQPSRYLVLVDSPEQIAGLDLPNVCGYCTVSPEGEVQYYQKE